MEGGSKVDTPRIGHDLHEDAFRRGTRLPREGDLWIGRGGAARPKDGLEDGEHGFGALGEGGVEGFEHGGEDEDDFGGGEEGSVAFDVFGDVFGDRVAPAVDYEGCWVGWGGGGGVLGRFLDEDLGA